MVVVVVTCVAVLVVVLGVPHLTFVYDSSDFLLGVYLIHYINKAFFRRETNDVGPCHCVTAVSTRSSLMFVGVRPFFIGRLLCSVIPH